MFPPEYLAGRHAARARRLGCALGTAGLLLLPWLAGRAAATSIRRMTLAEVVAASETIVEGRVESVRSFWEGKQILTEVRLAVDRSFRGFGAPGSSVNFIQLGGRVSSPVPLEMTVPGAPLHRVGDEGFYFLQGGAPGPRVIVGLSRGHVAIRRDSRGAYVVFDGDRLAPAEFADAIRSAIAGQTDGRPRSQR